MKSKKIKYPNYFSPHYKPTFPFSKPSKTIPSYTELSRIRIYDGEELALEEGFKYKISLEHDYSDCYYPDDNPSIVAYLIAFCEEDIDNPNYKKELAKYNRENKKYQEVLDEWNKWKAIWDEDQKNELIRIEKEQLKKLKEKYES